MLDHIDRYDWVILGGTDAARQGARFAVSQGARVALVDPVPADQDLPCLGQLMRAGVDVVLGEWLWERSPAGQLSRLWSRRPPWLVRTEERWLWGDRYLDAQRRSPPIPAALTNIGVPVYLPQEWEKVWGREASPSPQCWVVLGGDVTVIASAQRLAKRGDRVTLFLPNHGLVSGLFNPADRHLQNLLESDGVEIVWDRPVSTLTSNQLPEKTNAILVAPRPQPLTLKTGPKFATAHGQAIASRRLQTSLPYLYVCGTALGGYTLPEVTESEVLTAIAHGLGHNPPPIDYGTIPWTIPTDPPITQWGNMTPHKTRPVRKYPCDDGGILWMTSEAVHSQTKIVGAAGVGQEAQRAITTLATMGKTLGRSPRLGDLMHFVPANSILKEAALMHSRQG